MYRSQNISITPTLTLPITLATYLVHLVLMCVVQFATISNTIHHRRAAMMNQADRMLPLVCAQFCTVLVGSGESPGLHGQAKYWRN